MTRLPVDAAGGNFLGSWGMYVPALLLAPLRPLLFYLLFGLVFLFCFVFVCMCVFVSGPNFFLDQVNK